MEMCRSNSAAAKKMTGYFEEKLTDQVCVYHLYDML